MLFVFIFKFVLNAKSENTDLNSSSIKTPIVFFPSNSFGGFLIILKLTFCPSFITLDLFEEESKTVVWSGLVILILLTKLVKIESSLEVIK